MPGIGSITFGRYLVYNMDVNEHLDFLFTISRLIFFKSAILVIDLVQLLNIFSLRAPQVTWGEI